MRIGLDIDMDTNRAEGYLMAEFKVRELYPKGRKKEIDPDCPIRFLAHLPGYVIKEIYGGPIVPVGHSRLSLDVEYSINDLWEKYQDNKENIDSVVGREEPIGIPTCEHSALHLASDIDSYMGLE